MQILSKQLTPMNVDGLHFCRELLTLGKSLPCGLQLFGGIVTYRLVTADALSL